jgi:hypothetical protein
MDINERTLRSWRAEALEEIEDLKGWDSSNELTIHRRRQCNIILHLTQELLDINLLREVKENAKIS